MKVVKIELRNFSHYYEKADNLQAIIGMVESHIQDSDGNVLCFSVEDMDEDKFNLLPEFMGF